MTPNGRGRAQKKRSPAPRILIVSEGRETEPSYFRKVCKSAGVTSAEVRGDCDPQPLKVIEFAARLRRSSLIDEDEYDKVYCVFDRDSHLDYGEARKRCKKQGFHPITSDPCFEYWLLLHLTYSARPFANCGEAESAVKQKMPEYDKTDASMFAEEGRVKKAIANAPRNRSAAKRERRKTPMTNADELVRFLQNLAKRRDKN